METITTKSANNKQGENWYCEEEVEGAGKIKCRIQCDHCGPAKENNKDGLVSLAELEPGSLFEYKKTIALKTEYISESGTIEAFILGSGEMFWGGTDNAEDQRKLLVKKVTHISYKEVESLKKEVERTSHQLYVAIDFICSRDKGNKGDKRSK